MTERSPADEEIMRAATADDDAAPAAKPEAKPADDTLELGGDDAPELTDEQKAEAEKEKGRSRPWSRRVDNLTARLREAERERDEAIARSSGKTTETPTLEQVEAKKPNADNFEFGQADPDYLDALTDWKLDVREAKTADERRKAGETNAVEAKKQETVAKLNEGMANIEKVGTEKYNDFEAKMTEAVEARGGEPLHPMVSIGIAVSPAGADIAYRLATDETVSDKIETLAKTNPHAAAIAFGELEGEYLDDDGDADLNPADPLDMARMVGRERARRKGLGGKAGEVKTTKAPAAQTERARGGAGQFEVDDATNDFAAFERKIMGKKG